jgi:hypothetical protein
MTTLRDRLADLAEDAPAGSRPPDHWRAGRRRARRLRIATAGTVLVAAALVGIGSSLVVTRVQAGPEPAGSGTKTVLPDRFFEPSSRLPVAHHPPGQLIAASPWYRESWTRWTGWNTYGVMAISATTQAYSFLELPGWLQDNGTNSSWALSPDGRHIAYWYQDDPDVDQSLSGNAQGLAIYDTESGELVRHDFDSAYGVQPVPLAWAGRAVLTQRLDIDKDPSVARRVGSVAVDVDSGELSQVSDPHQLLDKLVGSALPDGTLALGGGMQWFPLRGVSDLTGPALTRADIGQHEIAANMASLSPGGQWLALGGDVAERPNQTVSGLRAGRVLPGVTKLAAVPGWTRDYAIPLGWRDDHTLVVESQAGLTTVDLTADNIEPIAALDLRLNVTLSFASDLLDSPVVRAKEPPRPWKPQVVFLVAAVPTGLLLWAVGRLRRRRAGR